MTQRWVQVAAACSLAAVLLGLGVYLVWAASIPAPAWQMDYRPPVGSGAVSKAPGPGG